MLLRLSLLVTALCGVSLVSAQNDQRIPVRGAPVPANGQVPIRKNILDLHRGGGRQWWIYARALDEMYNQNYTEASSFFQIAGIHGKPYTEYNQAGPRKAAQGDWAGYCPHGEDLFLPWHRPYLVLFEQRLVEIAVRLAREYPPNVRSQWVAAAETLRAPYWDWAADPTVPFGTARDTVKVEKPIPNTDRIEYVDIPSPLRTYRFPPQNELNQLWGPWDDQRRTQIYRCTAPNRYPESANNLLSQESLKSWVYDAFTYSTTFKQFASTRNAGVSLEQIHNVIHWDGACGGQFLDADFSAFDPLFMMHHANVDRLWTYWQFIRPNEATFTGSYKGQARFATPRGTTISDSNPLWPFWRTTTQTHTSASVRDIRNFGYTYAGLEYWRKSADQLRRDATAVINNLYGPTSGGRRLKRDAEEKTRYFAQVSVNVEELDRPCIIELFVNDVTGGRFVVMKQPQEGTASGEFPLDEVSEPIENEEESVTGVVDTLLSKLRVEITKADGTNIPVANVPSLKLSLTNVTVVPPQAVDELPEFKDAEKRPAPKKQHPPGRYAGVH